MSQELSIKDIFAKQNSLGKLLSQVKKLEELDKKLKEFIPKEYTALCCVANLREGCLVIQANNAAIATWLKYQTVDLLSQFRMKANLPGLRSIKIIVRTAHTLSSP